MPRLKLRSKGGCVRCRRRRQKCDEHRPKCGFCNRWSLSCDWPATTQPQTGESSTTQLVRRESPGRPVSIADPFNIFPIPATVKGSGILHTLDQFFDNRFDDAVPFKLPEVRQRVFRAWLESISKDEAVCYSFMTYCMGYQSELHPNAQTRRRVLECETRLLSLLRHRIEAGAEITDGTLLAATIHCSSVAHRSGTMLEVNIVLSGIKALITARGGFKELMRSTGVVTVMALLVCDMFSTFSNVEYLGFPKVAVFRRPRSMTANYPRLPRDLILASYLGSDIMDVLEELRFLMYYRTISAVSRNLTLEEQWYIADLHAVNDSKLSVLHSVHRGKFSLEEIAVLGMSLMKWTALQRRVVFPFLMRAALQQLHMAIGRSKCQRSSKMHQLIFTWASMVALLDPCQYADKVLLQSVVAGSLDDRYGAPTWPETWTQDVKAELEQVLWDEQSEGRYREICAELENSRNVREQTSYRPEDEVVSRIPSTLVLR